MSIMCFCIATLKELFHHFSIHLSVCLTSLSLTLYYPHFHGQQISSSVENFWSALDILIPSFPRMLVKENWSADKSVYLIYSSFRLGFNAMLSLCTQTSQQRSVSERNRMSADELAWLIYFPHLILILHATFYVSVLNNRILFLSGLFVCLLSTLTFAIIFLTIRDRDFILGMHTLLIITFQMTPRSMTLWPWLWPLS